MLPKQTGTYLAIVKSIGLEEKDNGTVQAAIVFDCTNLILANGDHEDASDQGLTGYFNLVKKDGKLNEISIRNIKDALGWDGASFAGLQDGDYAGTEVQIVIDNEEYNGKTSMRVKYLNPKDYAGGLVKKADSNTIKSLDAKFGSMLRATAGTAKLGGGAVKKTASGTSTPANGSPGAPAIGRELAWKEFTKLVDAHNAGNPSDLYSEDDRKEVFKKVVTQIATEKGKKPSELDAPAWAQLTNDMVTGFSPGIRDLIPF